jgi:hypothetical protein
MLASFLVTQAANEADFLPHVTTMSPNGGKLQPISASFNKFKCLILQDKKIPASSVWLDFLDSDSVNPGSNPGPQAA